MASCVHVQIKPTINNHKNIIGKIITIIRIIDNMTNAFQITSNVLSLYEERY